VGNEKGVECWFWTGRVVGPLGDQVFKKGKAHFVGWT